MSYTDDDILKLMQGYQDEAPPQAPAPDPLPDYGSPESNLLLNGSPSEQVPVGNVVPGSAERVPEPSNTGPLDADQMVANAGQPVQGPVQQQAPQAPIQGSPAPLSGPSGPQVSVPPPAQAGPVQTTQQPPVPDDLPILPTDTPAVQEQKLVTNAQLGEERKARALTHKGDAEQVQADQVLAMRQHAAQVEAQRKAEFDAAVAKNAAGRDQQIADMRAHVVDPRRLMNNMSSYDIAGIGALAALNAGAGGEAAATYLKNAVDADNQYQKNRYDNDDAVLKYLQTEQGDDRADYTTRNLAAREALADSLEVAAAQMQAGTVKDNTVLAVQKMRDDLVKEKTQLAVDQESIRKTEQFSKYGHGGAGGGGGNGNTQFTVPTGAYQIGPDGKTVPVMGTRALSKTEEPIVTGALTLYNKKQRLLNEMQAIVREGGNEYALGEDSFKSWLSTRGARWKELRIDLADTLKDGDKLGRPEATSITNVLDRVPDLNANLFKGRTQDTKKLLQDAQGDADGDLSDTVGTMGIDSGTPISQWRNRRADAEPDAQHKIDADEQVINDAKSTDQQKRQAGRDREVNEDALRALGADKANSDSEIKTAKGMTALPPSTYVDSPLLPTQYKTAQDEREHAAKNYSLALGAFHDSLADKSYLKGLKGRGDVAEAERKHQAKISALAHEMIVTKTAYDDFWKTRREGHLAPGEKNPITSMTRK